MRVSHLLPVAAAVACCWSCGGSSAPTTPPPPGNPYVVTITTSGVNPKELVVPPGTRVLFINNDTRRRNMGSDPHPEHDQCPALNIGLLNPGQQRESLNLVDIRTCGYHDHDDPGNQNVWGRIIIR